MGTARGPEGRGRAWSEPAWLAPAAGGQQPGCWTVLLGAQSRGETVMSIPRPAQKSPSPTAVPGGSASLQERPKVSGREALLWLSGRLAG